MLRNYIKIAIRNLAKNKLFSGINIFGLAIGFVVMTLSIIFIKSEWDYDKWLPMSDQIYRAYRSWGEGPGGYVPMPVPFAEMLKDQIPGVEKATRIMEDEKVLFTVGNKNIYLEKVALVDSSFFNVFGFPFLRGDSQKALYQKSGVVLTEKTAKLFFGEENPIGKSLKVDADFDVLVTGVLKTTVKKSHLQYEAFIRSDETFEYYNSWLNYPVSTYILKNPIASIDDITNATQSNVIPLIVKAWEATNQPVNPEKLGNWKFQPLHDIHLYSAGMGGALGIGGYIDQLKIFALIALIVLLIAAINYMNLATAKASGRAKEVGMRKVSGANRGHLVGQFLGESLVQSMLALGIALVVTEFMLPYFNTVTGRQLQFLDGDWLGFLPPLIVVGVLIGLLAGIYPAFILSAFKPVKVLKGNILKNKNGQNFRQVLVVAQFSISVVLIIFMAFVFKQIHYMQQKELGFNGDQIVNISTNNYESARAFEQRKGDFLSIPGVKTAAISSEIPGDPPVGGMTFSIEGVAEMQNSLMMIVGPDFDKTLGLEIERGRFFSAELPNDTANAIIINEAFVERFNLNDPLNTRLKLFGQAEYSKVVGVMKDFHVQGVQRRVDPTFYVYYPYYNFNYISIKINPENIQQTLASIEEKWGAIEPEHPVRLSFLDKSFEHQYAEQKKFGQLMFQATILAIFITILGLFGLATFMAEQRTKEIGVRKVLGASMSNLINLLVKDFVILVLIAGVIAIPVGYWLVQNWLKDFPFRIEIDWLPFVLAILGAIILAIITVGYQSVKVSSRNPVEALKME